MLLECTGAVGKYVGGLGHRRGGRQGREALGEEAFFGSMLGNVVALLTRSKGRTVPNKVGSGWEGAAALALGSGILGLWALASKGVPNGASRGEGCMVLSVVVGTGPQLTMSVEQTLHVGRGTGQCEALGECVGLRSVQGMLNPSAFLEFLDTNGFIEPSVDDRGVVDSNTEGAEVLVSIEAVNAIAVIVGPPLELVEQGSGVGEHVPPLGKG